jgi:hypothetical protein
MQRWETSSSILPPTPNSSFGVTLSSRLLGDTILKEAEQQVEAEYIDQVLDTVMRYFYIRAGMRKHTYD